MFDYKMDEQTFWKTMNPARLHALFSAHLQLKRDQAEASQPKPEQQSLSAFMMGGV